MAKMTNKDRFLRDGVSVEEFINELCKKKEYVFEDKEYGEITKTHDYEIYITDLTKWFNEQATPTLTEDERIILKFIVANHKTIFRDKGGDLWTRDTNDEDWTFYQFEHLFQFIKERRRI